MPLAKKMKRELIDAIALMRLQLSNRSLEQLWLYMQLMAEWNKSFNLTSIPLEGWIRRHIMDSLSVLPFLQPAIGRLADIGSGAGLPGIPLAIVTGQDHWTLIEKNGKKASFLLRVKNELLLSNVEVVHSRAEDLHSAERNSFFCATARAVGSCELLCRLAWPLLASGGRLIAMKGQVDKDKLAEMKEPWSSVRVKRIELPARTKEEKAINLSLVIWEKG